jgi:hypothetical protein
MKQLFDMFINANPAALLQIGFGGFSAWALGWVDRQCAIGNDEHKESLLHKANIAARLISAAFIARQITVLW